MAITKISIIILRGKFFAKEEKMKWCTKCMICNYLWKDETHCTFCGGKLSHDEAAYYEAVNKSREIRNKTSVREKASV